jgi:hypothetical protein
LSVSPAVLHPRRQGIFPGRSPGLRIEPPSRTFPTQPSGSVVSSFQRKDVRLLEPWGGWYPLTVAGAAPVFHRLPSSRRRSPARAAAPGKRPWYSLSGADESDIGVSDRFAAPLVSLPRVRLDTRRKPLELNDLSADGWSWPVVERACRDTARSGTKAVRLNFGFDARRLPERIEILFFNGQTGQVPWTATPTVTPP